MASGIDTVIFDMDGVIFDSEILVLQAWKEVAERHGIAGVEAACHECLGTNSVVSKGVFLKQIFRMRNIKRRWQRCFSVMLPEVNWQRSRGLRSF